MGIIASSVFTASAGCYDEQDEGTRLPARPHLLLSSSMAEHPAVNRRVVGSSPT